MDEQSQSKGKPALRMTRREFVRMSLILGLTPSIPAALAACAPQGAEETMAPEDVNLSMVFDDLSFWQTQAQEFTAKTGINVQIETVPFMQVRDKYVTSFLAGGGEYDLVPVRDDNVIEFGPKGWIESLDDRITPDLRAQHFEGSFDYLTVDGSTYGIPRYVFLWQLYYNTEIFEKVGLTEPPKTWAEFREYALKMSEPPQYGFIASYGTTFTATSVFTIRLRAEGGDFLKDGKPAFNTPEGITALRDLVEMGQDGSMDPSSFATGDEVNTLDLFLQGKVGMILGIPLTLAMASNPDMSNVVGKVGVALMPGSKVPSASISEMAGIGYSSSAEDTDACWEYAKFVTSAEEQKKMTLETGLIPTQIDVLEDPEVAEKHPAVPVALEQFKYPIGQAIVVPEAFEIYTAAGNELVAALRGEKEVEKALEDAETATLQILGQ